MTEQTAQTNLRFPGDTAKWMIGDRVKITGCRLRPDNPNIGRLGIVERVAGPMSDGGVDYLVHLYDRTWADHEAVAQRGGGHIDDWFDADDLAWSGDDNVTAWPQPRRAQGV